MPKTRKCALCGREFVPNSGTQKYCSEECAEQAKEVKKKRQRDFLRAFEPVMELQQQEYLTFSKAAILLGCTRQYVYKLVEQGRLPASRLSSRMALVRRSDIERMFDANPYNRVIPCSKPKKATLKKQRTSLRKNTNDVQSTDEVLEYYSGEEVMQTYKVKQSWLYASAKRHQIPMCRIAGRNYYSKKHIDAVSAMASTSLLSVHMLIATRYHPSVSTGRLFTRKATLTNFAVQIFWQMRTTTPLNKCKNSMG